MLPVVSANIEAYLTELQFTLNSLVQTLRADLDNGAMTLMITTIAGIAGVSAADFDEGQLQIYVDSDDSDKVYLCTRVSGAVIKVEMT